MHFTIDLQVFYPKMLEWKEREHENDDFATLHFSQERAYLWNCGLLKYFKIQNMQK
jgi:hypothetical protein